MEIRINRIDRTSVIVWPIETSGEIGSRGVTKLKAEITENPDFDELTFDDGTQLEYDTGEALSYDTFGIQDAFNFRDEVWIDDPALIYRSHALLSGAEYYWTLDERSDLAGRELVTGANHLNYVAGAVDYREWEGFDAAVPYGGAIECINDRGHAAESNAVISNQAGDRSVSFYMRWVDLSVVTGNRWAIRIGAIGFRVSASSARIVISGGDNDEQDYAWRDDRWYHVELRHSGGDLRVFIDGAQILILPNSVELEGTLRIGVVQSNNPTLIGIDEISIGPPGHFDRSRARHMRRFGGYIYQPKRTRPIGRNAISVYELPLVGYKYFLEKNFVPGSYAVSGAQTIPAIIRSILSDTGLSHLYTLGGITASQLLDRVIGNDDTADAVIQRIGSRVGHYVWVDPLLELQMRERSQALSSDVELNSSNVARVSKQVFPRHFTNSVVVRGNQQAGQKSQSFVGDGVSNTVLLDFQPETILSVKIDTIDDTASWTVDNETRIATRSSVITLDANGVITYSTTSALRIVAEDASSIASIGRIQRKFEDNTIYTATDAQAVAAQLLDQFNELKTRFDIVTVRDAIQTILPGISPLVNIPEHGINQHMLIEKAKTHNAKRGGPVHHLTATEENAEDLKEDFWRRSSPVPPLAPPSTITIVGDSSALGLRLPLSLGGSENELRRGAWGRIPNGAIRRVSGQVYEGVEVDISFTAKVRHGSGRTGAGQVRLYNLTSASPIGAAVSIGSLAADQFIIERLTLPLSTFNFCLQADWGLSNGVYVWEGAMTIALA